MLVNKCLDISPTNQISDSGCRFALDICDPFGQPRLTTRKIKEIDLTTHFTSQIDVCKFMCNASEGLYELQTNSKPQVCARDFKTACELPPLRNYSVETNPRSVRSAIEEVKGSSCCVGGRPKKSPSGFFVWLPSNLRSFIKVMSRTVEIGYAVT